MYQMEFMSVFLEMAKFNNFQRKMLMSAERKGVSHDSYHIFVIHILYHCRICMRDFR